MLRAANAPSKDFRGIFISGLVLLVLFCGEVRSGSAGSGDFNIDGVFEAALDLPRILFLLKRDPNG